MNKLIQQIAHSLHDLLIPSLKECINDLLREKSISLTIADTIPTITRGEQQYLLQLAQDGKLNELIEKWKYGFVYSSIADTSSDALQRRHGALTALIYIQDQLNTAIKKDKAQRTDGITGEQTTE